MEEWAKGLAAWEKEQKEVIGEQDRARFRNKVEEATWTYGLCKRTLEEDEDITCWLCKKATFDLSDGISLSIALFCIPFHPFW